MVIWDIRRHIASGIINFVILTSWSLTHIGSAILDLVILTSDLISDQKNSIKTLWISNGLFFFVLDGGGQVVTKIFNFFFRNLNTMEKSALEILLLWYFKQFLWKLLAFTIFLVIKTICFIFVGESQCVLYGLNLDTRNR